MSIKIIRVANDITVPYTEIKDSPRETIRANNNTATRVFEVAWADRITFAKQMTGFTTQDVSGTVTIVYIYEPHKYPDSSIKNLYAKEANIAGLGVVTDDTAFTTQTVAKFDNAQVTISYETPEYPQGTDVGTVYVSESLEPATEFLTMRTDGLGYSDGVPLDEGEAPGYLIRMVDWVYTIHELNAVPAEVLTLPGSVNSSKIFSKSLGLTFPVGTLLFGNPSLDRQHTADGATAWTVTFRLTYRPNGWNFFPRVVAAGGDLVWSQIYPVALNPDTVVWEPTGEAINFYPSANFSGVII